MTQPHPSAGDYPTELRGIAAYGLAGSLLDLPTKPLSDREFIRVHADIRAQKLTGLLWAAICDGAMPVTPPQRSRAEESHVRMLAGVLLLENLLLEAVSTLREVGVPVRVLKGPAMAHLDYPDPGQRIFGDIDLLVPSRHFDDAVAALVAAGCTRRFPEPRPGFDRRFGKGACLVTAAGLEIDLHRNLTMGPFGERLAVNGLWQSSESFNLAGLHFEALDIEARALHAAYHAVLGDRKPQLVPLRDLAQVLLTKPVSWDRLQSLARASEGEPVLALAVRTAWRELHLADVLAISAWAERYREDERSANEVSVYQRGSTYAGRSFATIRSIPSVAQKVRFLMALTLPQRSYLDGRHTTHRKRLRQGLADIRRIRESP